MVKETKLYDLLGVKPDADADTLKKAYRKKAIACHPDKESDPAKKPQAEAMFKEISTAYETLSNAETRAKYDRYGEEGLKEGGGGGGSSDARDVFERFFGGGGSRAARKPKPIVYHLDVPLKDFYLGRTRKLAITRSRFCATCKGSGARREGLSSTCTGCRGQGVRMVVQQIAPGFVQQSQVACPQCRGSGSDIKEEDKCPDCKGSKVMDDRKVFEVHIEKGMKNDDFHAFVGEGNQVADVEAAGDVVIVFKERADETFKRKGKFLIMDYTMTLADALCGFEFRVTHLDGREIVVKSTPGQVARPGLFAVHHEGMPVKGTGGSDKGDLIVNLSVQFPRSIPPKTVEVLRQVLGPKRKPRAPIGETVEVRMTETTLPIESFAGRDQSDDAEMSGGGMRGGPGVQTVQCQQQ